MGAYSEVFQRIEKKYVVDDGQRRRLQAVQGEFMALDDYGRTAVVSVYLDTPERSLIERSLEKPLYKEKLRLRAYGEEAGRALVEAFRPGAAPLYAVPAVPVFMELKKKFKGVVYKRRVGLSLPAARAWAEGAPYEDAVRTWPLADAFLQEESLKPRSLQIARELQAALNRYSPLTPSAAIAVQREAWAPLEPESEVRITYDGAMAFLDLRDAHARWRSLSDRFVMEIKNAGPYPFWLIRSLNEAGAYPSSFSKYGFAYRRMTGQPVDLWIAGERTSEKEASVWAEDALRQSERSASQDGAAALQLEAPDGVRGCRRHCNPSEAPAAEKAPASDSESKLKGALCA